MLLSRVATVADVTLGSRSAGNKQYTRYLPPESTSCRLRYNP